MTSQSIETYEKINLAGMCSHPINANRLRCHTKKWADMGTFNTECYCYLAAHAGQMQLLCKNIDSCNINQFSTVYAISYFSFFPLWSIQFSQCSQGLSPTSQLFQNVDQITKTQTLHHGIVSSMQNGSNDTQCFEFEIRKNLSWFAQRWSKDTRILESKPRLV